MADIETQKLIAYLTKYVPDTLTGKKWVALWKKAIADTLLKLLSTNQDSISDNTLEAVVKYCLWIQEINRENDTSGGNLLSNLESWVKSKGKTLKGQAPLKKTDIDELKKDIFSSFVDRVITELNHIIDNASAVRGSRNQILNQLWPFLILFINTSLANGKKIITDGDVLAKVIAILEAYCKLVIRSHERGEGGPNDHERELMGFLVALAEGETLFGTLIDETTAEQIIAPSLTIILKPDTLTKQLKHLTDTLSSNASAGSSTTAAASSSATPAGIPTTTLQSLLNEYLLKPISITHENSVAWIKKAVARTILDKLKSGEDPHVLVKHYCALIEDINSSSQVGEGNLLKQLKAWSQRHSTEAEVATDIPTLKRAITPALAAIIIAELKKIAENASREDQRIAQFIGALSASHITNISTLTSLIILLNAYAQESILCRMLNRQSTQNSFQLALVRLLPGLTACAEYVGMPEAEHIQMEVVDTRLQLNDILQNTAVDKILSAVPEIPLTTYTLSQPRSSDPDCIVLTDSPLASPRQDNAASAADDANSSARSASSTSSSTSHAAAATGSAVAASAPKITAEHPLVQFLKEKLRAFATPSPTRPGFVHVHENTTAFRLKKAKAATAACFLLTYLQQPIKTAADLQQLWQYVTTVHEAKNSFDENFSSMLQEWLTLYTLSIKMDGTNALSTSSQEIKHALETAISTDQGVIYWNTQLAVEETPFASGGSSPRYDGL